MKVQVQCDHPRGQAAVARLRRRARAFLGKLGLSGAELSILLVGDRGMRRLNRTWRGKDVPTDVLSFPAAPGTAPAAPRLLGDVVLSLDTAARVARLDGRAVEDELDRYLVHGILHLLGFDHELGPREAREMAAREEAVLGGAGMVGAAEGAAPGRAKRRPAAATEKKKAVAGAGARPARRPPPRTPAKEKARPTSPRRTASARPARKKAR